MSLKQLAPCITCHAWNADGTKVALCPNNNEIVIYRKDGTNFVKEFTLTEHDQVVTGIDWAPKSNRIVTCSQDRNAYVWTWKDQEKKWKPVLVILRINRAATHVKWSPLENKFAVASGARCVSVCYFEEDNDWWVSKHIKKHKSTVLTVDWHPNNALLATSSSDFKVRIFSAFIKGVDKTVPQTPFGNKFPFGELFAEIDTPTLGWVHACKWSPSGNLLAFVGHDSSLNVADISSGSPQVTTVRTKELPFQDLIFVNEGSIIAVGWEANPTLFEGGSQGWKFVKKLDTGDGGSSNQASKGPQALKVFVSKVDKGQESVVETRLETKHQNAVSCIQPYKSSNNGTVSQYSLSGADGNLSIWDAPK